MKKYYHLISSIMAVVLTSLLLVALCFAWYATNTTATVGGASASTMVDREDLVEANGIKYYSLTNKATTETGITYEVGAELTNDSGSFPMVTYEPFSDNSEILMEITLKSSVSVSLNARTRFTDSLSSIHLTKSDNPLSSVISFTEATVSGTQVSTGLTISHFSDPNTPDTTIASNVNIIERSEANTKIYVVLGYYAEAMEYIYSNNIGNRVLDPGEEENTSISYACDFYFLIGGAV